MQVELLPTIQVQYVQLTKRMQNIYLIVKLFFVDMKIPHSTFYKLFSQKKARNYGKANLKYTTHNIQRASDSSDCYITSEMSSQAMSKIK